MQTGKAARIALLLTASGLVAFGCQFVAGIAGLEAADDTGETCDEAACGPYACNAEGTACTTSCSRMMGGCKEDAVCAAPMNQPGTCNECGWSAMGGVCPSAECDSCAGNVCTRICDAPNECMQADMDAGTFTLTLDTRAAPIRLECKDQCNDILVACMGGSRCEVVCEEGGCQNVTVKCGPDGECSLVCKGQSCAGATVVCGDNRCTATCDTAVEIEQTCGGSCDCTSNGCL
ncbi:MAG TPA: hypothetical protein VM694_29355 [Polyangium sp.]|nr:hypothetical protein [Polyangium sp.]